MSPRVAQGAKFRPTTFNVVQPCAVENEDDSDDVSAYESDAGEPATDSGDEIEVHIGPTRHSAAPLGLEDLWIPSCHSGKGRLPILSTPGCLRLSDVLNLSALRGYEDAKRSSGPLSFGSVIHMNCGSRRHCRPCMFERAPTSCKRKWLCDFCHLHFSETKKARSISRAMAATQQGFGQFMGQHKLPLTSSVHKTFNKLSVGGAFSDLASLMLTHEEKVSRQFREGGNHAANVPMPRFSLIKQNPASVRRGGQLANFES